MNKRMDLRRGLRRQSNLWADQKKVEKYRTLSHERAMHYSMGAYQNKLKWLANECDEKQTRKINRD